MKYILLLYTYVIFSGKKYTKIFNQIILEKLTYSTYENTLINILMKRTINGYTNESLFWNMDGSIIDDGRPSIIYVWVVRLPLRNIIKSQFQYRSGEPSEQTWLREMKVIGLQQMVIGQLVELSAAGGVEYGGNGGVEYGGGGRVEYEGGGGVEYGGGGRVEYGGGGRVEYEGGGWVEYGGGGRVEYGGGGRVEYGGGGWVEYGGGGRVEYRGGGRME